MIISYNNLFKRRLLNLCKFWSENHGKNLEKFHQKIKQTQHVIYVYMWATFKSSQLVVMSEKVYQV